MVVAAAAATDQVRALLRAALAVVGADEEDFSATIGAAVAVAAAEAAIIKVMVVAAAVETWVVAAAAVETWVVAVAVEVAEAEAGPTFPTSRMKR